MHCRYTFMEKCSWRCSSNWFSATHSNRQMSDALRYRRCSIYARLGFGIVTRLVPTVTGHLSNRSSDLHALHHANDDDNSRGPRSTQAMASSETTRDNKEKAAPSLEIIPRWRKVQTGEINLCGVGRQRWIEPLTIVQDWFISRFVLLRYIVSWENGTSSRREWAPLIGTANT